MAQRWNEQADKSFANLENTAEFLSAEGTNDFNFTKAQLIAYLDTLYADLDSGVIAIAAQNAISKGIASARTGIGNIPTLPTDGLTTTRLNGASGNVVAYSQINNLLRITGSQSSTLDLVNLGLTAKHDNLYVRFKVKLVSLNADTPAIGLRITDGTNTLAFYRRSTGQLLRSTQSSFDIEVLPNGTTYDFIIDDELTIEIFYKRNAASTIRIYGDGGAYADQPVTLNSAANPTIGIVSRGKGIWDVTELFTSATSKASLNLHPGLANASYVDGDTPMSFEYLAGRATLAKTSTAGQTETRRFFHRFRAVEEFAVGKTVSASAFVLATVISRTRVLLIFRNASFGEISRVTTANASLIRNEIAVSGVVPANTAYVDAAIDFLGDASFALSHKVDTLSLYAGGLESVPTGGYNLSKITTPVYVASDGDDANTGLIPSDALATINAALVLLKGQGTIYLAEGDYRQSVDLALIGGRVEIANDYRANARILGSSALTVSKTAGRTQIYQASLASAPAATNGVARIFDDSTPSKPISETDRHPLDRGQANRLPFTELLKLSGSYATLSDALDALDLVGGRGFWHHDSGTIYFALVDGGNATAKDMEAAARNIFTGTPSNAGSLILTNLAFMYSSGSGVTSTGLDYLETRNCRCLGNVADGVSIFSTMSNHYFLETAANGNDGENGHGSVAGDFRGETYQSIFFDSWGHDNWDEGNSYHERGMCSIKGGLYEYNHSTDGQIVPAAGADYVIENTILRHGDGNGIDSSNASVDGGREVQIYLKNVTSHNNAAANFKLSLANAKMELENCASREAGTNGFERTGGTLILRDCTHRGAGTAKSGTITVENGSLVT